MKKILSLTLVLAMVMSMGITTAFAAGNWEVGTMVTYTATGTEAYTVTVPAELAPGGSGNVVASGTWDATKKLVVTADDTVLMHNGYSYAADGDEKSLDVTFAGIELFGSNTDAVTATETISVAEMTNALFGSWQGLIEYNVELVKDTFTFTLDGAEHTAEYDMTWEGWINSEYNTLGWTTDSGNIYTADGQYIWNKETDMPFYGIIYPGQTYTTVVNG